MGEAGVKISWIIIPYYEWALLLRFLVVGTCFSKGFGFCISNCIFLDIACFGVEGRLNECSVKVANAAQYS